MPEEELWFTETPLIMVCSAVTTSLSVSNQLPGANDIKSNSTTIIFIVMFRIITSQIVELLVRVRQHAPHHTTTITTSTRTTSSLQSGIEPIKWLFLRIRLSMRIVKTQQRNSKPKNTLFRRISQLQSGRSQMMISNHPCLRPKHNKIRKANSTKTFTFQVSNLSGITSLQGRTRARQWPLSRRQDKFCQGWRISVKCKLKMQLLTKMLAQLLLIIRPLINLQRKWPKPKTMMLAPNRHQSVKTGRATSDKGNYKKLRLRGHESHRQLWSTNMTRTELFSSPTISNRWPLRSSLKIMEMFLTIIWNVILLQMLGLQQAQIIILIGCAHASRRLIISIQINSLCLTYLASPQKLLWSKLE